MPCGIWHSLDNGNGPATFRMSSAIDTDLITQEWYAWLVSAPVGPTPPAPASAATGLVNTFGGAPASLVVAVPATTVTLIVILWDVVTGVAPATLTSAVSGLLAPVAMASSGQTLGNQTDIQIFAYTPAAADTLTAASASPGVIQLDVYPTIAPGTVDQTGVTTGTNLPNPVTTGGAVTASDETVFWAQAGDLTGTGGGGNYWSSQPPYSVLSTTSILDNNGTFWGVVSAWGWNPPLSVFSFDPIVLNVSTLGPWAGVIATLFATPSVATTAILTVLEAFDVVVPPANNYLTVPLPKLTPAAIEALKALQAQILAKDAVTEDTTDAG
jgi:hypothetical protein